MVQGWTHEPRRTAESLPRISLLGMPNEESLVSQITESKIAYSQVNLSPSPSITEQARLPSKEMELSPDEHLQRGRPGLGWKDPLQKGTATHSSILAWRIPWTIPWGHRELDMTEQLSLTHSLTQREAETKQINSEPCRSLVLLTA